MLSANQPGNSPDVSKPAGNNPSEISQTSAPDLGNASLPSKPAPQAAPSTQVTFSVEVYDANKLPDIATVQAVGPLFHRIYADRYVVPAFSDPQIYLDELKTGKSISIIVRDSNNQIVGHGALLQLGDKVTELGRLVVDQTARGHNLGKVVKDEAVKQLYLLHGRGGCDVGYTEALTCHFVTQKMFAAMDWKPTAIFDRKYTDFLGTGHRETVLRMGLVFNPDIKLDREVYLPQDYAAIGDAIYRNSECVRTVAHGPKQTPAAPAGSGVVIDEYELPPFGASTINAEPGRDKDQLLQDVADQFAKGAQHVSVRLDATHPGSVEQANHLRQHGFYFAGLEMQSSKDYLVLQKMSDAHSYGCLPYITKLLPQSSMDLADLVRNTRDVH